MDFSIYLRGLGLSLSLIVAIGAQNAFVLKQGLRRRFLFPVALGCSLCDASLIALGAGGFGALVSAFPALTRIAALCGAAFLLFYGARSFRSAYKPAGLEMDTSGTGGDHLPTLSKTLLTLLAFSLLNPHVYLDTIVLLGGIAGQYAPRPRIVFALGAMTASFVWFFGLAYGAARLAPLFRKPAAWRILDALIGCTMWAIALSLLLPLLHPSK